MSDSSHGLTVDNLMECLPAVLRQDTKISALAQKIAETLVARKNEIDLTRLYPAIDSLPEPLLDILANDFKVDWYEFDFPIESKRAYIKRCFEIHKRFGTPSCLKQYLAIAYDHATVEEWWQYNGEPYHYKISVTGVFSEENNAWALKAAARTQNARSVLDAIVFNGGESMAAHSCGAGLAGYEIEETVTVI